jgi:hypothetical protein
VASAVVAKWEGQLGPALEERGITALGS